MKNRYSTDAGREIANFLRNKSGEHLTVQDIYDQLHEAGSSVGMTTVYRHVSGLVENGCVKKFITDRSAPACFEYIGNKKDDICEQYHLKCEKCGRLIHLRCEEIEEFSDHLLEEHSFRLDPCMTVFYGVCGQCLNSQKR